MLRVVVVVVGVGLPGVDKIFTSSRGIVSTGIVWCITAGSDCIPINCAGTSGCDVHIAINCGWPDAGKLRRMYGGCLVIVVGDSW